MASYTVGSGKDYATLAAAVAQLSTDGAGPHTLTISSGETFAEQFTVSGVTGPLTVTSDIAGSFYTFQSTSTLSAVGGLTVQWCDFDVNGGNPSATSSWAYISAISVAFENCIFRNIRWSKGVAHRVLRTAGAAGGMSVTNCLFHDIQNSSAGGIIVLDCAGLTTTVIQNNTITDITCTSSGNVTGINQIDDADHTYSNNLVTDIDSTSGTPACYGLSTISTATSQTNGSDDATSPETGLRNLTISFANAASDDFQLAAGDTGAHDVGTDLGSGTVAVDLNNRNRDTQGDTWDLGAYEYVAGGGGGSQNLRYSILMESPLINSPLTG